MTGNPGAVSGLAGGSVCCCVMEMRDEGRWSMAESMVIGDGDSAREDHFKHITPAIHHTDHNQVVVKSIKATLG